MIHHVINVRFKDEATEEGKRAMADGLLALQGKIDTIRSMRMGRDLRTRPDNFHFSSLIEFDDLAGYLTFRDHPEHQRVVHELIRPVLADRAGVVFEWPSVEP